MDGNKLKVMLNRAVWKCGSINMIEVANLVDKVFCKLNDDEKEKSHWLVGQ